MAEEIKIIDTSEIDSETPDQKKSRLNKKAAVITGSTLAGIIALSIFTTFDSSKVKEETTYKVKGSELSFDSDRDKDLWQDKVSRTMRELQDSIKALAEQNETLSRQIEVTSLNQDEELVKTKAKNEELERKLLLIEEETKLKLREVELLAEKQAAEKAAEAMKVKESSDMEGKIPLPPPRKAEIPGFKLPDPKINPEGRRVPGPPKNPFKIEDERDSRSDIYRPVSKSPSEAQEGSEDEQSVDGALIGGLSQADANKFVEETVQSSRKFVKSEFAGYLPEGSFAEVAIITGLDAGASAESQENPMPVMMRVQSDAVVPAMQGRMKYKLKGCFLIGSAYGDISAERVMISPTRISCIDARRKYVISAQIQGVITDFDASNGLRGTVDYKDGPRLYKAILASSASAVAQLGAAASGTAANTMTPTVNYDTGQMNLPEMGLVGQSVGVNAFSGAAEMIAQRYAEQLSDLHPVIYLPSGRKGTLFLSKGVQLQWKSYDRMYEEEVEPTPGASKVLEGGVLEGAPGT